MKDREFAERIVRIADEYYYIAENQWSQLIDIEPVDEDSLFEFRRITRAALLYYVRSYLVLDLVETDDDQELEDLLEIVQEQERKIAEFMEKNNVLATIHEESEAEYSRLFSVAEAMRTLLMQTSSGLAASLPARFVSLEQQDDRRDDTIARDIKERE